MPRKFNGIELNKAINNGEVTQPSVFDKLVSEVVATEIPAKYIEYITVIYKNGQIVQLAGNEITQPMPVNKDATWKLMEDSFAKIKDVRIYVDTKILGKDVNEHVDALLDKYLPD